MTMHACVRLVHIMDQRELRRGEGPIACVLVPTRELALQIYTEVRRYCRVYNIEVCLEQFSAANRLIGEVV